MSSQDCRQVSRYIILGLTVLGWIFSIVSVAHCAFVVVLGVNVGLFKEGYQGASCVKYSSSNFSTSHKVARAFGVLLTLGLSAAMILVILVVLVYPQRPMWIAYRVLMGFSFAFNLFTFSIFADCVDSNQNYYYTIACTVGGASVCAIINSFLLLATSIMSCIIPVPTEPVFITGMWGGTTRAATNTRDFTASDVRMTIKRTIEETPEGTKITKVVTDGLTGETTTTTTFEPSESSQHAFDAMGPTITTTVTDLPNGTKTIEEDAQGNKTITTKIFVMAGEAEPPESYSEENVVVATAAIVPPDGARQSSQVYDEERGMMANPYLAADEGHTNQSLRRSDAYERSPNQGRTHKSSRSSKHASSGSSSRTYNHGGTDDGLDQPAPPRDTSQYIQDSASSGFEDSANYNDSSFVASSSAFESSGNFDDSFVPGESGAALDGVERKSKKKHKKKKHRKHRSSGEHGHSSRHRESRESETAGVEADPAHGVEPTGGE